MEMNGISSLDSTLYGLTRPGTTLANEITLIITSRFMAYFRHIFPQIQSFIVYMNTDISVLVIGAYFILRLHIFMAKIL